VQQWIFGYLAKPLVSRKGPGATSRMAIAPALVLNFKLSSTPASSDF